MAFVRGDLEALGERPDVADDAFVLENPWLLKATLSGGELQARLGSMVAYQGELRFERARAGWQRIFKRALTTEGGRLMRVSGTGQVLLALESGIEWDIRRIRRGLAGQVSGGLFNTYLSGSGWVALVSDGRPVLLNPSEALT